MTNNPYKLEFTLKQHTPIIHFQHQQAGATLRASEVKPKLDRFIWDEWVKVEGGERAAYDKYKHLLIGDCDFVKNFQVQRYRALNYKIKIEPVLNNPAEPDYPGYFANMGPEGRQNPKRGLIDRGEIEMSVFSLYDSLIESLKKYLPRFIATNNFGNRKTKGYGSFEVQKILYKGQTFVPNTPSILRNSNKCVNFIKIDNDDFLVIFSAITQYWARLKSGLNFRTYEPSYYRDYLKSQVPAKHWEKKWLKEKFLDIEQDGDTKEYFRAWLGLQSSYEFKKLDKSAGNPNSISYQPATPSFFDKIELQITVSNDVIKRIMAPVTFKPILQNGETTVYILVEPLKADEIQKVLSYPTFRFTPKYSIKRTQGREITIPATERREYEAFKHLHSARDLDVPASYPNLADLLSAFHERLDKTLTVTYARNQRQSTITATIEDL